MSDHDRPLHADGHCDDNAMSAFVQIPIIDFADARNPDPATRHALASRIRDAAIHVGFFYIKNHGIPEDVIHGAIEAGKRFFALPLSYKSQLDVHKSPGFRGYNGLLSENTNPENDGDLHEGFNLGWEPEGATATEEIRDDGVMSGANAWPDPSQLPGFKEPVMAYYHEAVRLGQSLFPLFALALGLAEDWFDDKTRKPAAIMRLVHYPPQPPKIDNSDPERVIGIGAHTDYECFTILWQDQVGGLQVQNAAGKWVDALPIPGTLVLNLGDQFARWTNDLFKSTLHRAANRSAFERYSMPLFFGTDYDVRLEPIPGCASEDNPAKYEVVTAGEHVRARLEAGYSKAKKS